MNKYKCFKCGKEFNSEHELDTDKPTCDSCFEKLLTLRNYSEYKKFLGK